MDLRALLRRARERAQRRERDAGDASLQIVICFPAALFLLLLVVDTCNIYLAQQAAQTAAREAVATARGYGSGTDAGLERARTVLTRLHGTILDATASSQGSTANRVHITVHGRAQSLLGLTFSINEQASGPVEKWTTP